MNKDTAGPVTYIAEVERRIGRNVDGERAMTAYQQGKSAESYALELLEDCVVLDPFEIQIHPGDGELRWFHEDGDFIDAHALVKELNRVGIKFKFKEQP